MENNLVHKLTILWLIFTIFFWLKSSKLDVGNKIVSVILQPINDKMYLKVWKITCFMAIFVSPKLKFHNRHNHTESRMDECRWHFVHSPYTIQPHTYVGLDLWILLTRHVQEWCISDIIAHWLNSSESVWSPKIK